MSADLKSLDPGIEWLPVLLECQIACPAISLAGRYAGIIVEHSRRRQIISLAADVTELKARPVADVDEEALAAALAELDIVGPTVPEIIAAVRSVFADAGSEVE